MVYHGNVLEIFTAPKPSGNNFLILKKNVNKFTDFFWENQNFTQKELNKFQIISKLEMIFTLIIVFGVIFGCNYLNYTI